MASPICTTACPAQARRSNQRATAAVDIYPSFTCRNVQAAPGWLAGAFGLQPRVVGQHPGGQIQHAAAALQRHGADRVRTPCRTHGSHTGQGRASPAIGAHYQQATRAGAELLNQPHDGPGGMRGYSARDLEGNVWTFGTARPAP